LGRLFRADIFSEPRPAFAPISAEARTGLVRILAELRPEDDWTGARLSQIGGNEINSRNFKVERQDGLTFLLKKISGTSDRNTLERQLSLQDWLHRGGSMVPGIVRTAGRRLFAAVSGSIWLLGEFVEGNYFVGRDGEVLSVAEALGAMQSLLLAAPSDLHPIKRRVYDLPGDAAIVSSALHQSRDWPAHFGEALARQLDEARPRIEAVMGEFAGHKASDSGRNAVPCHGDLHPHNILISPEGRPRIIDLDALTIAPLAAATGFAIYKLARQQAVCHRLSEGDAGTIGASGRAFLAAFDAACPAARLGPNELRFYALREVFRRMAIIFRLNVAEGNRAWNHVLPMHLAGLDEIEVIFSSP
jgi:Ser/Thr protein kinase RdoA (MazF antagonist)